MANLSMSVLQPQKNSMRTIMLFFAIVICSDLLSQQVVATAGNSSGNAYGSISYTIGEGVSQTFTSGNITVTQGFQQPAIFVSLLKEPEDSGVAITIFPNPTRDFLKVKILNEFKPGMQYLLLDINGRLLLQKKLESSETEISFNQFSNGIYFIKVQSELRVIKTFKIVKE